MPSPTRALTVADVHRYVDEQVFRSSGDLTSGQRVGIELEWVVVPHAGAAPSPETIRALLPSLPGGSKVTFEPGGQLELSGPPAACLSSAITAMHADTAAARASLAEAGIDLVGSGVDTRDDVARVLDQPRYAAMEAYFDAAWPAGRTMMRHTASIQVNVDLGGDAVDARWHRAHDLGPVLTACFANSPLGRGGRPTGFRSTRAAVWRAIDPARTDAARREHGSVAAHDWTRYVLDAPVMMVRVDTEHSVVERAPRSFAQWIADGHELGWPTLDDLAYHTTTLFPPVRPRGWLELRVLDALPEEWWPVAVAVTVALLDDPQAAARADLATPAVRDRGHVAARDALHDADLAAAARQCFAAARDGLVRLDVDQPTLDAVDEYTERYVLRRRCPADDLLDEWAIRNAARV